MWVFLADRLIWFSHTNISEFTSRCVSAADDRTVSTAHTGQRTAATTMPHFDSHGFLQICCKHDSMDASCLYQCFRRRCNIMGDFLAHFSVPAEHCCLRVADRVPLWLQFAIVDASSRKTHHSSHPLRPVSWSWRWSLHPNILHSHRNGRFKSWMLVWWCHDDVAWTKSVRNVC